MIRHPVNDRLFTETVRVELKGYAMISQHYYKHGTAVEFDREEITFKFVTNIPLDQKPLIPPGENKAST